MMFDQRFRLLTKLEKAIVFALRSVMTELRFSAGLAGDIRLLISDVHLLRILNHNWGVTSQIPELNAARARTDDW